MNASKSQWIREVAEADFETEVLQRSHEKPVVLDFWAPWCGPCRMLGPLLEHLAEEKNGDFLLAKINTDENQNLAAEFNIQGIPAVKAIRNGKITLEFEGLLPEAQLRQFIDQICPTEADRLVEKAKALEASNSTESEAICRKALEQDPNLETAIVGLTRALIAQNRDAEAIEVLERIGPGGEQGAEYERLDAVLYVRGHGQELPDPTVLQAKLQADPKNSQIQFELGCALARAGNYAEALANLLAAAERNATLASTKVKELMVKIFHIVGVRSPLADEYRDKLTRVLY